jgi:hypothetical protein
VGNEGRAAPLLYVTIVVGKRALSAAAKGKERGMLHGERHNSSPHETRAREILPHSNPTAHHDECTPGIERKLGLSLNLVEDLLQCITREERTSRHFAAPMAGSGHGIGFGQASAYGSDPRRPAAPMSGTPSPFSWAVWVRTSLCPSAVMARPMITPTRSSTIIISPVRAGVGCRTGSKRIITAPMRIAASPMQQASLSRQAIWWRRGGDIESQRRDTSNCPSPPCNGSRSLPRDSFGDRHGRVGLSFPARLSIVGEITPRHVH